MNPQTALIQPDNPTLWKQAEEVLPDEIGVAVDTAKHMYTVMLAKDGAGLAAPQVGFNKRFFIIRTVKDFDIYINPEIIEKSKNKSTDWEGCLSKPGYRTTVRRPRWITLRFVDVGKGTERRFEKNAARVIQHELDHLNGICIFPRPETKT